MSGMNRLFVRQIVLGATLVLPVSIQAQVLELSDVLKHVRVNHPQVLQQRASVDAKKFGANAVSAQRLPSFSVEAGARSVGDSASGAAVASMPILTFGKLDTQIDVAKAEIDVEVKKLAQTENDVMENAAQVYAAYFNLVEKIAVSKRSLVEQNELLARIGRREKAGYASTTDKRTIEVRIIQLKAQVEELELRLRERRAELAILLDRDVVATESLVLPSIDLPAHEESVSRLRLVNPAAQSLFAQLQLAKKQVEEVTKSDRPTVNVVGTQPVSNAVSNQFSLGLEFKYTYGNMGVAKREKIGQAESLVTAKSKELENTVRESRRRFESAETGIRMLSGEQIPTQANLVRGLEKNIEAYTRQYHAGRKSLYELINTHRELTDARLKLVDLRTDYFQRSISKLSGINQLVSLASK